MDAILNAMQVLLGDVERDQLYHELLAYFGLVGALNECQAPESAWQDPYNRREIEDFIRAWLRRRQRRREEPLTWVV